MKLCLLILLQVLSICVHAQGDDAVFTVNARVQLTPPIDSLIGGRVYHFSTTGLALKDIVAATITNGKAVVSADSIKVRTNNAFSLARLDSLQLYKIVNGKQQIVLNKQFVVVRPPALINVDSGTRTAGPPSNEVKLQWLNGNRQLRKHNEATVNEIKNSRDNLSAFIWASNTLPVIVFYKLEISCNGIVEQFNGTSDGITKNMRGALNSVIPGCSIKLYDIRCQRPGSSNDLNIIGPFNIFIIE